MPATDSSRIALIATPALLLAAASTAVFADAGMLHEHSAYLATIALAGILGALLGALSARLPGRLGLLAPALAMAVACDLAFGLWLRTYNFVGDHFSENQAVATAAAWTALLLPGVAVLAIGRRNLAAMAVAGGVFWLTTLLLPPSAERVPPLITSQQPAGPLGRVVVHIMLDEHIGPNGIPSPIPGADGARRDIVDFYTSHGFRLYPNATSLYTNTEFSLATLLRLDRPAQTDGSEFPEWHEQMPWFAQLKHDGYKVMVYSVGGFYNLCSAANRAVIDTCRVYRSDKVALDNWPGHRLRYLSAIFVARSEFAQLFCRRLARCPALMIEYSISSATVLDRVAQTLAVTDGDVAIFAHVLLPHGPQLLDGDCRPEPNGDLIASDEKQHFARYFEQIACTRVKLSAIMGVLEARHALDRAIVIVHGDHGLRSNSAKPEERYPPSVTNSALFAVRAPGLAAGIDLKAEPVQALLPAVARDIVR